MDWIGLDIVKLRGTKKIIVSQKGFHNDIKTVRSCKTPCDSSITEDPPDNDPEFSKEKYTRRNLL